jgi:hypothetical protein
MGPAIAIPTKRNSVVISIAQGAYSGGLVIRVSQPDGMRAN